MAGFVKSPRPTRVPLRLHARSSRTEMEKRSRVVLPSAARRRSLRSGSVPAVSPPALHFTARRTADRSNLLFFTMKPGDGNFQTFGNRRHFVIHQIAFLPLNSGNRSLVENDAFDSQPSGQIILRNRRITFQARFPNPPADDVPARQLMSFFQNM